MSKIISLFKAAPHAPRISDPKEVKKQYRYWRIRIMYSTFVGYAMFYFCRKNFNLAMPVFLKDLGYTKTDLGLILTLFSITYGVAKFVNGVLADRANPRFFMPAGLILSAIMGVFFGLSSGLVAFGVFWIINAWAQGMGWPPCARSLTHWYAPTELATKWAIWNASHQIGGAGIAILAPFLISHFGWRSSFIIPSAVAIIVAIFLINRMRDTPQSLGLPPIEEYYEGIKTKDKNEDTAGSAKEILFKHVFNNRLIWILCFANMFVYIVRIGVLDWAPTFLVEAKGASLTKAGFSLAGFELSGILGAIFFGWISDKVFKGRRGPVNLICMILIIAVMIGFWKIPPGHHMLDAAALIVVGFLIYGPQFLVAVAAADFASKKAAATATGLTGTFGYVGAAVCGVGTGLIVDKWGWNGGFIFFIAAAVAGAILFLFTLKHRSAVLDDIHKK